MDFLGGRGDEGAGRDGLVVDEGEGAAGELEQRLDHFQGDVQPPARGVHVQHHRLGAHGDGVLQAAAEHEVDRLCDLLAHRDDNDLGGCGGAGLGCVGGRTQAREKGEGGQGAAQQVVANGHGANFPPEAVICKRKIAEVRAWRLPGEPHCPAWAASLAVAVLWTLVKLRRSAEWLTGLPSWSVVFFMARPKVRRATISSVAASSVSRSRRSV